MKDYLESLRKIKDISLHIENVLKFQEELEQINQRLKIIIKQYEIEKNISLYKEVKRIGKDGEAIKVVSSSNSSRNKNRTYQKDRVYIVLSVSKPYITAISNHYDDFGEIVYFIPHEDYVVLEKK
jgi:hypothetical protein